MKYLLIILCVGGLLSCTTIKEVKEASVPKLLIQQPLPEFPESVKKPPPQLDVALLVAEDGSVTEVKLFNSSGDEAWDNEAKSKMLQWKFIPAYKDNQPVESWVRLKANIKYETALYYYLAEILCSTYEEADSVYKALKAGVDFGELAKQFSTSPSRVNGGYIGKTNIQIYPKEIKQVLLNIGEEKFTEPLQFGKGYIILKRFKEPK